MPWDVTEATRLEVDVLDAGADDFVQRQRSPTRCLARFEWRSAPAAADACRGPAHLTWATCMIDLEAHVVFDRGRSRPMVHRCSSSCWSSSRVRPNRVVDRET